MSPVHEMIVIVVLLLPVCRVLSLLRCGTRTRRTRTFAPRIIVRCPFPRQRHTSRSRGLFCSFPIALSFRLDTFAHRYTTFLEALASTRRAAPKNSAIGQGEEEETAEFGVFSFELYDTVFKFGEVGGL
jgi:hypothetical protein